VEPVHADDETRRPSPPAPVEARLRATAVGTNLEAFGAVEWGLLAAIALMWGSSFFLMDIGLTTLDPAVVTLARIGLGALALALVPRARRTPVARPDLPRVALLGLVWMAIPLTLFPIAQQWIDSSVAGMVNAGIPLTTAAWAALFLRRLPGLRQSIGLVVGFAGIVAVTLPAVPVGAGEGSTATALGAGLVVLAVVLYGIAANIAVPLQQRYGALPVLLRAQLFALIPVVPLGLIALPRSSFAWGPALAMIPLGVLGTGVAFVMMTTLVGRVGGPRGTVAIYFVPLVAIALGAAFLNERIHPLAIFGTVLVLIGAWIASRREGVPPAPTGRG
jgi:drug/metabolite transporter (DMT)-like permease